MDLTLNTISDNRTAVVTCRGRIHFGPTARRFRSDVAGLIARHRRVVLDLSGVTDIDASGIGALAALIRNAHARHVALLLATPKDPARRLVKLSRLHTQVDWVRSQQRRAGNWAHGRTSESELEVPRSVCSPVR